MMVEPMPMPMPMFFNGPDSQIHKYKYKYKKKQSSFFMFSLCETLQGLAVKFLQGKEGRKDRLRNKQEIVRRSQEFGLVSRAKPFEQESWFQQIISNSAKNL